MHKWLLLLPISLCALEVQPWFREEWEFNFDSSFTYSRYRDVQGAHPQLKATSNDHVLAFDLGVATSETWAFDVDIEFADTPRQKMGLRSSAFQLRYQWLDDIPGDPVTLITGASIRGVSGHSLKDVSCPYHYYANYELSFTLGKEWYQQLDPHWMIRAYLTAAAGIANRGAPWANFLAVLEGHPGPAHRLGLFGMSYLGFGSHIHIDVDHFHGYASIRHRSIDVGATYAYVFEDWGTLRFAYTRRVFARLFPENVNFFTVSYSLPFTFF